MLCYFGAMSTLRQWFSDKSNQLGIIVGFVGLLISFAGRPFNLGRELGDPLPVVLSLSQALRGSLIYPNWGGVLWHLLFILFLVLLIAGIVRLRLLPAQRLAVRLGAAARLAIIINVAVVAFTEVDAIVVGFWYVMAGFVSLFLAGALAEGVAKIMNR